MNFISIGALVILVCVLTLDRHFYAPRMIEAKWPPHPRFVRVSNIVFSAVTCIFGALIFKSGIGAFALFLGLFLVMTAILLALNFFVSLTLVVRCRNVKTN